MTQLNALQKSVLNLISRGIKFGDKAAALITELTTATTNVGLLFKDRAFVMFTPTGASPTVTMTASAEGNVIIAAHATPPTTGITLVLPSDGAGRTFTIINNSVLSVTAKGKTADTGVAVATTKTAKFIVLADNTVKRLTADI